MKLKMRHHAAANALLHKCMWGKKSTFYGIKSKFGSSASWFERCLSYQRSHLSYHEGREWLWTWAQHPVTLKGNFIAGKICLGVNEMTIYLSSIFNISIVLKWTVLCSAQCMLKMNIYCLTLNAKVSISNMHFSKLNLKFVSSIIENNLPISEKINWM